MARKGNQQTNGLGGSTSSHKKGGLQSGSSMPNKKQKGSAGNTKDGKREEYSSDAQPSVFVVDASQKPNHVKEDKKKTGDHGNVKIQGTAGAEQSEPCGSTSQDYTSTTGEEDKWASKNRKFESVELPETVGVGYLKKFVSSVSKATTEWLHKHRPLLDILVTKILTSRDYVRMKIKHAYPIVLKWLAHFMSILLVLSMVWLDCTLRGIDSVLRMGTTSFLTVIWCSIFSAVAMIGMLKFITVGAIVVLVALFVGFTLGLLLLVVSGIVFLWLYGSFWTTLTVLAIAGMSFTFSHERLALLIMTLYSLYSAWTLVGWLGLIFALNLSFFSSDALIYLLRNNMNEHRRANSVPEQPAGMQSGPGEEEHTDGGSHPPADHGSGVPSTTGSDSEDEVVRLLNSADHYSALGLSRFQEIDVTFLKREYRKKGMRCPTNTHKPSFHVNTSVMSKHSYSKGASSSHRGGGMPNMDETMTEEEFMEWLQKAVQSGMFDNFAAANGGSPSNSSKNGSSSSSKRKKKGKKW